MFDFSKAEGYNEDIVRANINQVRRDKYTMVAQPTAVKEIVIEPQTDFVNVNKECGRKVARVNSKRNAQLRQEERRA